MTDEALVLSQEEWETLYGICNHYMMATAWADDPPRRFEPAPGKAVIERRALAKRILETK